MRRRRFYTVKLPYSVSFRSFTLQSHWRMEVLRVSRCIVIRRKILVPSCQPQLSRRHYHPSKTPSSYSPHTIPPHFPNHSHNLPTALKSQRTRSNKVATVASLKYCLCEPTNQDARQDRSDQPQAALRIWGGWWIGIRYYRQPYPRLAMRSGMNVIGRLGSQLLHYPRNISRKMVVKWTGSERVSSIMIIDLAIGYASKLHMRLVSRPHHSD